MRNIKNIKARISANIKRLNELEEMKTQKGITPSYDAGNLGCKVDTNNRQDAPFVNIVCDIEILKRQIEKDTKELNGIIDKILSLEDANYINLLYGRYVEEKSIKELSHSMHYSFQHIFRLQNCALQNFYVLLSSNN